VWKYISIIWIISLRKTNYNGTCLLDEIVEHDAESRRCSQQEVDGPPIGRTRHMPTISPNAPSRPFLPTSNAYKFYTVKNVCENYRQSTGKKLPVLLL
jgi:hypothetical protein